MGGFFVAQPLDVSKHHRCFQVGLQHVQPLLKVLPKLAVQRQLLRTFARAGQFYLFIARLGEVPPRPLFAKLHQRGVGGDTVQPSTDPGLSTKSFEVSVSG
jgi:hypothetical protein